MVATVTVYNADAGEERRDDWGTPDWLFNWCVDVWGPFDRDVAASADNAKCRDFIDAEEDGLLCDWGRNSWCNPPFNLVTEFTERAALVVELSHACSLLVLPASTDLAWFHANVLHGAAELVFLRGRVSFVLEGREVQGNNAGTMLAYYAPWALRSPPRVHSVSTRDIKRGLHGAWARHDLPRQMGFRIAR